MPRPSCRVFLRSEAHLFHQVEQAGDDAEALRQVSERSSMEI